MRLPFTDTRAADACAGQSEKHLQAEPTDRLVVLGPNGAWEVRPPHDSRTVLCTGSRAAAVQWAWNITRDTGGQVILLRRDEDQC